MKKVIFATMLAATPGAVAAAELHGTVKVDVVPAGDSLEFKFTNVPNAGLVINLEGPWKLELKKSDGLAFAKTTLARGDLNESDASYKLTTSGKPTKGEGELEYKFITFVCTKDKTTCYRDVHEGKTPWKSQASK